MARRSSSPARPRWLPTRPVARVVPKTRRKRRNVPSRRIHSFAADHCSDFTPHVQLRFLGIQSSWMLNVGCWMLDVGCWMLDVGCWMLDVGCWMFDVGCSMLDVRCWMLDVGSSVPLPRGVRGGLFGHSTLQLMPSSGLRTPIPGFRITCV